MLRNSPSCVATRIVLDEIFVCLHRMAVSLPGRETHRDEAGQNSAPVHLQFALQIFKQTEGHLSTRRARLEVVDRVKHGVDAARDGVGEPDGELAAPPLGLERLEVSFEQLAVVQQEKTNQRLVLRQETFDWRTSEVSRE